MSKLVKLGILILIIVAIYLLLGQGVGEGFIQGFNGPVGPVGPNGLKNQTIYSGNMNDKDLYPLSYQLVPNNGPSVQGPNGVQSYYGPSGPSMGPSDSNLYQMPLMYPKQLYPKVPWYPNYGKPCAEGECGATGTCVNGACAINKSSQQNKTVFNVAVD